MLWTLERRAAVTGDSPCERTFEDLSVEVTVDIELVSSILEDTSLMDSVVTSPTVALGDTVKVDSFAPLVLTVFVWFTFL